MMKSPPPPPPPPFIELLILLFLLFTLSSLNPSPLFAAWVTHGLLSDDDRGPIRSHVSRALSCDVTLTVFAVFATPVTSHRDEALSKSQSLSKPIKCF